MPTTAALIVDPNRVDGILARRGVARAPLSGQWELTRRCNLRCVHCYTDPWNNAGRLARELSTHEVIRILDELQEAGCLSLAFTGGDPLARPDFPQIYQAAVERGFLVTVLCNGTLVGERTIRLWTEYPPEGVEITLNGISPGVLEAITTVPGSHARVLRGIRLVREAGLPLTVKANAMRPNFDELLAIKAFVRTLPGVRFKLSEEIFERLDGSVDACRLSPDPEVLDRLEAAEAELSRDKVRKRQEEAKPAGCPADSATFHIDAEGGLQLCSRNRQKTYDLRRGSFKEGFERVLPVFGCPSQALLATVEATA